MSILINSNLNSLTAQRQLGQSGISLSTAIQRLSSGLRINSAKDDAAGQAISERFTTQINGVDQASRNANDAISLAQLADGALGNISSNLQRGRELAVQSANDTNSVSDRAALQAEAAQLIAENDRIVATTDFNGSKLLDGSFVGRQIQAGANRQQSIAIAGVPDLSSDRLGTYRGIDNSFWAGPGAIGPPSALSVTLNGPGKVFNLGLVANDVKAIVSAINGSGVVGLSAEVTTTDYGTVMTSTGAVDGTANVSINGISFDVSYKAGNTSAATQARQNALLNAVNAQSAATGVSAHLSGGNVYLRPVDGANLTVSYSAGTAVGSVASDLGLQTGTMNNAAWHLYYQPPVSGVVDPGQLVTGVTVSGAGLGTISPALWDYSGTALNTTDISTASAASTAISTVDVALATVNAIRANFGAMQNRFQSAMSNLQQSSENMSAARGRIRDADFAQETAALSRAQILQQAGTAMVTMANQSPQGVLTLLR